MAKTLKDKMKTLGAKRRQKIDARATHLITEELTLRALRQARHLTQERMAVALNIGQSAVSRLEKRTDLLISTLRSHIEALGGHLCIVVEFPDRPPVVLSGLATMENETNNRAEEAR